MGWGHIGVELTNIDVIRRKVYYSKTTTEGNIQQESLCTSNLKNVHKLIKLSKRTFGTPKKKKTEISDHQNDYVQSPNSKIVRPHSKVHTHDRLLRRT